MPKNELIYAKEKLNEKINLLKTDEKKLEKKLKRNLAWWFLFPIFGLFIYNSLYVKRRQNSETGEELLKIKTEMTMLELEVRIIETKII
ncbi:hypothetical protein [Spiroplasma tabanidicola]|nr:hypothetical protein [Spiroplasma tabanidicola]